MAGANYFFASTFERHIQDQFEIKQRDVFSFFSKYSKNYTTKSKFLYTNDISSIEVQTPPNISFTHNADIKMLKIKHHGGKHRHRSNKSSSCHVRHIINDLNITAISENSARTVTLPRQSPRTSPLVLVHTQHLPLTPTAMPLSLTGLYKDPGATLKLNKRLIYQPNRVARFDSFSFKQVFGILQCLLACFGQLFPRHPFEALARIPSRFESEPMLECAYCDLLFPYADLTRHKPRSAITYTEELLAKVLAPQHVEQCSGRLGGEMLLEDDVQMAVSAVSEFHLVPSKTIDSFSGSAQKWLGSKKVREESKLVFTSGNILLIHPELFQQVVATFTGPPREHFKVVAAEFWLPPDVGPHTVFGDLPHPRLAALNYFFVQTPPDQSGPQTVQIFYSDAMRRIREVHYDRGTIANPMDIEAKEMADCRKRYDSFNKSEYLKGRVGAYQLSQLGFFFIGDRNFPGKLRCSFCRRTIHMYTTIDAPYLEKDFERRLVDLLHRHSHFSATCPFSLGLNGDDKQFSADDIVRVIEPLHRTNSIQLWQVNSGTFPHVDINIYIRSSIESILQHCVGGLPRLDGDDADAYNNLFAAHEYELCTFFQFDSEVDTESYMLEDFILHSTPIDYFIGVSPKYTQYIPLLKRIESFYNPEWKNHPLSRLPDSSPLKPASLARAGFFYTGTADNVTCFWCGLGLNHWEPTDDPVNEHVRFTPRCTWLLRLLGRHRVKALYLKSQGGQQANASSVQNVKEQDYSFIRDVDDIPGGLDSDHLCPVDYRTELREAKARVDRPPNRAILDEFGYSVELLLHALESQLKETGNDHQSSQQLLETLWAYEEWKSDKKIDSDADFVARAEELRRHRAENNRPAEQSQTTGPAATQPATSNPEESICVVCMSAPRSIVLIPCGHLAVCQSCYSRLQQCPVCRSVIRGAIRSYIHD